MYGFFFVAVAFLEETLAKFYPVVFVVGDYLLVVTIVSVGLPVYFVAVWEEEACAAPLVFSVPLPLPLLLLSQVEVEEVAVIETFDALCLLSEQAFFL